VSREREREREREGGRETARHLDGLEVKVMLKQDVLSVQRLFLHSVSFSINNNSLLGKTVSFSIND
jgi:hypothetical protein